MTHNQDEFEIEHQGSTLPEEARTPEIPLPTETPDIPEVLELPDTLEVPETPEVLEARDVTETSDMPESSEVPEEAEPEIPPTETPEKAPPTRLQKFFRQLLIWLIIIVIAFTAGLLLDHFLRYKPLSDNLLETQSELEAANQAVAELQEEIVGLEENIETANTKVEGLEEDLDLANARLQFYQVLVDINNARIAMFDEDTEAALAALENTQQRLEELEPVIQEENPELALSLPRRLELIVSGLERDPEIAKIDLELFTKDLLELELYLF